MLKFLIGTDLKVNSVESAKNDSGFVHIRESKHVEAIEGNTYFTEEEKWELTQSILKNQDNFSIFMRLNSVFEENKEELVYVLTKILRFCTVELNVKERYNTTQEQIVEIMNQNKLKLMDDLMNQ